eukprot:CAMPEP_0198139452 /NCGR_PEP_ID=MMETSP1443-20131203/2729_1 /TAXON_ID=186043 /ORGANISM="Entomoneis sp., Strain CCMP2396" /LENGTH=405 /DNA_ID=CAMNT_0043801571 /DNA_START=299 /DNA_END=1516 /DNA_ORIENTATION=+
MTVAESSTTNYLLLGGHATILALWGLTQYVYIPYPVHLLTLVTAILYVGCHQSLFLAPKVNEKLLQQHFQSGGNSSSFVSEPRETLRKEDAYQFPLVGSCALFSLYLAFKFLDKDLVNMLIGLYFAVAGVIAMTITFNTYVEKILPSSATNRKFGWDWLLNHPLPEWFAGPSPWDLSGELNVSLVLAFAVAAGVVALYFSTQRAWYLNNILAISFCLQGIRNFSVGSFQTAVILLIGLFFYDIFWVFGTEVMVKVATNLDGPIKILLPRDSLIPNPETGKLSLSLLGLGDIVIPGFFLSLMLRFDFHLAKLGNFDPTTVEHISFPKPYFYSTLVGYVAGLGTTLFVMFHFNAAQPALLYLVPACLGTSFGCAVVRGEVSALMEYTEEEAEEEAEEEDTPEKKKDE